jgi:hypothetical protein
MRSFAVRHGRRQGPQTRRDGGGGGDGAGPSGTQANPPTPPAMPEVQPLPAWILAGPAAPLLHADDEMVPAGDDMIIDDPDLAVPPPPLSCPVHGWACPRLLHGIHIEEAAPVAPAATSPVGSLDLPSPTPAQEIAGAGTPPSRAGLEPRLRAPVIRLKRIYNF